MNSYPIGTDVVVSVTFTTLTGQPVDPVTVGLKLRQPDGQVITVNPASFGHPGVGAFNYTVAGAAISGPWVYNWTGSGNLNASTGDKYFSIDQSAVRSG